MAPFAWQSNKIKAILFYFTQNTVSTFPFSTSEQRLSLNNTPHPLPLRPEVRGQPALLSPFQGLSPYIYSLWNVLSFRLNLWEEQKTVHLVLLEAIPTVPFFDLECFVWGQPLLPFMCWPGLPVNKKFISHVLDIKSQGLVQHELSSFNSFIPLHLRRLCFHYIFDQFSWFFCWSLFLWTPGILGLMHICVDSQWFIISSLVLFSKGFVCLFVCFHL